MPEPLKNLYNSALIKNLAQALSTQHILFDKSAFETSVFSKDWKNKELKQRMRHIAQCLHRFLPADYKTAINILKPVSKNYSGFEFMFFQDYVECYGLDDFKTSMQALEHFTKHSSSEFAVRAFILKDEKRTMKQMNIWANSSNHHVRRLASEGCRPRLPWAVALPAFKNDPQPVLPVLKTLMKDESEYVRRSVANNLNDISKDNPVVTYSWARQWLGTNRQTDALIKHACRTLLKQGDQKTLALFGYAEAKHIKVTQLKVQKQVNLGDKLDFSFNLKTSGQKINKPGLDGLRTNKKRLGKCRIEYAIDFVKANGQHSRKVFKIAEADYQQSDKHIEKYYSFKIISTRKYYAGLHRLTIIINGIDQESKSFHLIFD